MFDLVLKKEQRIYGTYEPIFLILMIRKIDNAKLVEQV